MKLTKLEINNYKSIRSPVTISFSDDFPVVFIGKNGSGKTNVLEALSAIALANSDHFAGYGEKVKLDYRAYIQLSEEDLATILPDVAYDRDKCEIVAYGSVGKLEIDRIRSEYIVSSLKKEISDIQDLASQLRDAIDTYEEQLIKISHNGNEELPIHCYNLRNGNGRLTNYNELQFQVKFFADEVCKYLNGAFEKFDDEEATINFVSGNQPYFGWREEYKFKLEYVEPSLARFEQKFVSINKTALKREITKINNVTKEVCERIDRLIKEIEERTMRIRDDIDSEYMRIQGNDEKYYSFLRKVKRIIGKRCLFLKNESNNVIFKKDDRDYYNRSLNYVVETYLREVYDGDDRDELIGVKKDKFVFSDQAATKFEAFLNKNIPAFDREMYDSISVKNQGGQPSIFLNERSGAQIDLNETSAGRRWYYTYYFMKSMLSAGDIFIIDEPAAMLHPSAQREVLCDLMELTKRGVKVVYSTHSPYLLSDEWKSIHFVTMTEDGTKVNSVSSQQEMVSKMTDIVGDDIFDVQITLEKYIFASPDERARNISDLIRETQKERGIKTLESVCGEIGIEYQAMKSWNYLPTKPNGERNPKFSSPSIQNIEKVLKWAKKLH